MQFLTCRIKLPLFLLFGTLCFCYAKTIVLFCKRSSSYDCYANVFTLTILFRNLFSHLFCIAFRFTPINFILQWKTECWLTSLTIQCKFGIQLFGSPPCGCGFQSSVKQHVRVTDACSGMSPLLPTVERDIRPPL